jgi:putative polyhydroxyalkanoate system protein
MPDIKYLRRHSLSLKDAKKVAQKTADDLAEEYDLKSEWEGDTLNFHRSGVAGHMHVTDKHIDLSVKLGFLLRPFKSKFEQHIERHLDELLNHARTARSAAKSAAKTIAKAAAKNKA